jgi:hypothetical protein
MKPEWRDLAIYKGFRIKCQFIDGYAMVVECVAEEDSSPLIENMGMTNEISSLKLRTESEVIVESKKAIDALWSQLYENGPTG